jgi:hypothetical protein
MTDVGWAIYLTQLAAANRPTETDWQRVNANDETALTAGQKNICPPRKDALWSKQIDNRED